MLTGKAFAGWWGQRLEWSPSSQGPPRTARNHRELEETRRDVSLERSEGAWPCNTRFLTSRLQNGERIHLFYATHFVVIVTAATGNWYTFCQFLPAEWKNVGSVVVIGVGRKDIHTQPHTTHTHTHSTHTAYHKDSISKWDHIQRYRGLGLKHIFWGDTIPPTTKG